SRTPLSAISIWCNGSLRRSTTSDGRTRRNAIIGTRLCPPASGLLSPPLDESSDTASVNVSAHEYSNGGNFISAAQRSEHQTATSCFPPAGSDLAVTPHRAR